MISHFVISWYLIRNFLKWTSIVGLAIITIIMLFDLAELIRKGSSKTDVGFSILLQMLVLKTPTLLQQVLPFVILFSSILTLWALNRYQEMTVMKASGISIWQIIAPLISVAWILGVLDLTVFNPVASHMMLRYEHMDGQYFQKNIESLAISESGLWIREKKGDIQQVFQIAHIDPKMHTSQNISVFQFDLQDHFLKRIEAKTASFGDHAITLNDVWQQTPQSMPQHMSRLELSTALSIPVIQNTGAGPHSISFWNLLHVSEMLENSGRSGHKYMLRWHSLLARWIWMGIMVILAASCSLRLIRQQRAMTIIGVGALCAFLLYILRDITHALGSAGTLPILLSAWAPVGISALLGVTALLYFEEG